MKRSDLAPLALNLSVQHALAALSARVHTPLHAPSRVTFEIVEVCNLKCLHCAVWTRRRSPDAMTLEEWLEHLHALRRWIGPFALGFCSGEPLLAREFLPLVAEASRLGVLTTCVTNGTLIDQETAARVAAAGLDSMIFSLDGLLPETHDFSRGVPGTHAKVVESIAIMQRLGGPSLKLATLINSRNLSELPGLVRWAAGRGLAGVSFQALRPYGDDWKRLWPEPAAARAAVEQLRELKADGWPVLNSDGQLLAMARYFEEPEAAFPDETCNTFTHWNVKADGN
ncbi:MAG: hypothetical protein COV48_08670, partial [Elusimicrobia bacterium CG11_big_fil_rev_8_21_14_0_20_64_6]